MGARGGPAHLKDQLMAILKFGVIVTAARGTIGGLVLSANKSGPYGKLWAKGANPQSPIQSLQRSRIGTFAQGWQGITSGQRSDWDTYAALPAQDLTNSLGETYSVSGFLWFVRINTNRAQAGQAQRDDAPTIAIPGAPTINAAFLKTDAAPTQSRLIIDIADSTIDDIHVVTSRLYNSEGRIAGNFNLANILTAVPAFDGGELITMTFTASHTAAGAAANLGDNDQATNWLANQASMPVWVDAVAASPNRLISRYRFRGNSAGGVSFLPGDWTLSWWNGGWNVFDTRSGEASTPIDWNDFQIADPAVSASSTWRMDVTDNQGSLNFVGMNDLDFFGYDFDADPELNFQTQLTDRMGTIQLGQKAFYQCRVQTTEGRRGAASSATALAEAT